MEATSKDMDNKGVKYTRSHHLWHYLILFVLNIIALQIALFILFLLLYIGLQTHLNQNYTKENKMNAW
jgi:uncharacterized protein YpmS